MVFNRYILRITIRLILIFSAMLVLAIFIGQQARLFSILGVSLILLALIAELFGLHEYPNMGDSTVMVDSGISGAPEPQEMWPDETGGPQWLKWECVVEWRDQDCVTYQE